MHFVRKHNQPDGLLNVLLDRNAEFGDRDDAAKDLAQFDDDKVIDSLFELSASNSEDIDLIDSTGHSLYQILLRLGRLNDSRIDFLHSEALKFFRKIQA